ncbi:LysR substrate-binding domain-containing protein [Neptunicella sp. SCSIO 80796]|uniref:LysR substrate-binding domain-containing protein n=1 Tax=Neptunicella plasticusilytica TaxID=3117012 RepID=UPI003A4D691F
MLEIKHLQTLLRLQQTGSLVKAAEMLCTSQSALSHQIKELEGRIGQPLFERKTSPIVFTPQGKIILELAKELLPKVQDAEAQLKKIKQPKPRFDIGIECHACFQWLLPAIQQFRQEQTEVDVDLIGDSLFESNSFSHNPELGILFTDEVDSDSELDYQLIGEFELVLAVSQDHPLSQKPYIQPADLQDQVLITYPVEQNRLDIFQLFLNPAKVQPQTLRKVENSNVILQMVAAGLGVSAVPDWLVKNQVEQQLIQTLPLTAQGIKRQLYAAYKPQVAQGWVEQFITISTQHFQRIQVSFL